MKFDPVEDNDGASSFKINLGGVQQEEQQQQPVNTGGLFVPGVGDPSSSVKFDPVEDNDGASSFKINLGGLEPQEEQQQQTVNTGGLFVPGVGDPSTSVKFDPVEDNDSGTNSFKINLGGSSNSPRSPRQEQPSMSGGLVIPGVGDPSSSVKFDPVEDNDSGANSFKINLGGASNSPRQEEPVNTGGLFVPGVGDPSSSVKFDPVEDNDGASSFKINLGGASNSPRQEQPVNTGGLFVPGVGDPSSSVKFDPVEDDNSGTNSFKIDLSGAQPQPQSSSSTSSPSVAGGLVIPGVGDPSSSVKFDPVEDNDSGTNSFKINLGGASNSPRQEQTVNTGGLFVPGVGDPSSSVKFDPVEDDDNTGANSFKINLSGVAPPPSSSSTSAGQAGLMAPSSGDPSSSVKFDPVSPTGSGANSVRLDLSGAGIQETNTKQMSEAESLRNAFLSFQINDDPSTSVHFETSNERERGGDIVRDNVVERGNSKFIINLPPSSSSHLSSCDTSTSTLTPHSATSQEPSYSSPNAFVHRKTPSFGEEGKDEEDEEEEEEEVESTIRIPFTVKITTPKSENPILDTPQIGNDE